MPEILKNSHQKFIDLVVSGLAQKEAYRQSIGKQGVSDATCESKSTKLAQKYLIQIQQARQNQQEAIQQAGVNELVQEALKAILTQSEVDAILCKIINGTLETEKIVGVDIQSGKIRKAMCKPTAMEISKAIDLYNKRFGSNAPIKTDQKVTIESNQVFEIAGKKIEF